MADSKFEKKAAKASEKKLSMMYLGRMDYHPSDKDVEELRILSEKIPEDQKAALQFAYYDDMVQKLNEKKFRLLTGYGQCKGSIVVHNGFIVMCCCREMASLVAFRNAHYFRGKIYVPGESNVANNHDGSVFIISDDRGSSYRTCPFCGAGITEKIDFEDASENGEGEEE